VVFCLFSLFRLKSMYLCQRCLSCQPVRRFPIPILTWISFASVSVDSEREFDGLIFPFVCSFRRKHQPLLSPGSFFLARRSNQKRKKNTPIVGWRGVCDRVVPGGLRRWFIIFLCCVVLCCVVTCRLTAIGCCLVVRPPKSRGSGWHPPRCNRCGTRTDRVRC